MNIYNDADAKAHQLPVLRRKIICLSLLSNAITTIHILTAHMKRMVRLHKFRQVNTCMNLANRLYLTGDELLKKEVEHVFIDSFFTMQWSCTKAEWSVVKSVIPIPLYTAYLQLASKQS